MPTNSPGNGKEIISAGIPKDAAAYIAARSKRLDKAKAWGVARIVELWLSAGAPPLSELDESLAPLPYTGKPALSAPKTSVEKIIDSAMKKKRKRKG